MRGHRSRRAIAIVACALWLLGVEALPGVHLATHSNDHTHAGDGSILRGEHRHGSVTHAHAKPQRPKRRAQQLAFDLAPSGHEAAGLAHHAVAYPHAAAPLLAPRAVDQPSRLVEHSSIEAAQSIALARSHARGPPA